MSSSNFCFWHCSCHLESLVPPLPYNFFFCSMLMPLLLGAISGSLIHSLEVRAKTNALFNTRTHTDLHVQILNSTENNKKNMIIYFLDMWHAHDDKYFYVSFSSSHEIQTGKSRRIFVIACSMVV